MMKKVSGKNMMSDANKGMPAKPKMKKGMGKGVKKPMKASAKKMGD